MRYTGLSISERGFAALKNRFKILEKVNCDLNKFNPIFRIMCRLHNLVQRGEIWVRQNLIEDYNQEYWIHQHAYTEALPVEPIPQQLGDEGSALDRLCAFDAEMHTTEQDNAATSEEEQIGSPLISPDEQENEDEEGTSESESSSQIIDYESDESSDELQGFTIDSILSEKIVDGTTRFYAKFVGSSYVSCRWQEKKDFITAIEKQMLKNWLKSKRSKGNRATVVASSTVASSRKTSGRPQRNKSQPARLSDYQLSVGKKNKNN